ncbi:MAG TPA: hypothetical protein VLF14_01625 [Candidatus Binatia bacterium]|nr:hypothetical protein [Candidatus Binatia bacterium]
MHHFDRLATRESPRFTLILLAAAVFAACSTYPRRAVQTAATKPTVSYDYVDDDGLLDATHKAESYCAQYGAWPTAVDFDRRSGDRHVTFACDQPRTASQAPATVIVQPSAPPPSYPYRDDRGLVDAVNQAQRYCLALNANARSTRVINNPDGSRTVAFECDRT